MSPSASDAALIRPTVGSSHGGQARLLDNGTVLFTPASDFNGEAWFDYRVDDGHGGSTWARATSRW